MITIKSLLHLFGVKCFVANLNLLPLRIALILILINQQAIAQVCDKKTTVFFESDRYVVQASEENKLQTLTKEFSQKTDTFLLEIYAFTDSIASAEYNYQLAKKRFKSIVAYLKKNSESHFEIVEKVRGEAMPLSSNATEAGRAKNRRVEIFYFKINGGRVTLRGKGGMEMSIEKDYFTPRGICECNPRMREIFTNEQAAGAGISMETSGGCQLITAGMLSMTFDNQDPNKCADVTIRIPAANFDADMEIWNSTPVSRTPTMSKWFRESGGQLEYDEKNKIYIMTVKYCPGSNINIDKLNTLATTSTCRDSSGVVAIPDLVRQPQARKYRILKSSVSTKDGESVFTMAKFPYKGKEQVAFEDLGMSKEKIGYSFSGTLDNYKMECDSGRCTRLKECWCHEIPLSAYTKIIYFQKKKHYSLKVPLKYRNYAVKIFIPAADTIIPVKTGKGLIRKYKFDQPLADSYVVFYKKNSDANNKRGYEYQLELEKIKKKFVKSKKVYKARIKRRQLKNAV